MEIEADQAASVTRKLSENIYAPQFYHERSVDRDMTSEEYGERELLEELAQNVEDAFPRLMEAYYSQLYGLVMSLVRDPQSAEDVMQDSCIRIFQALKRYPETRIRALKLRAWLFQIVRNQALTFLEKKTVGAILTSL